MREVYLVTEDDHSGVKHSVQYAVEGEQDSERAGEGRWGLVGRWMTRKRTYALAYISYVIRMGRLCI